MKKLIVTEKPEKWQLDLEDVTLLDPSKYLLNPEWAATKNIKVINLCRSYQYQSTGYYISLLAEARGHKVLPSTSTVIDFRFQTFIREDAQDFNELIQTVMAGRQTDKLELTIFFGFTEDVSLSKVGMLLFNLYQSPFLKASFIKKEKWVLQSLKPINLKDLNPQELSYVSTPLRFFLQGKKVVKRHYARKKYDLAIMLSPDDATPPSNPKAIQKFIKAAEKVGFNSEIITRNDFGKITQYDALFIRETTNVNHPTYRFARKAANEGLAVIDDPESILKCTNKVYLHELMVSNKIPTPRSVILRKDFPVLESALSGFPLVLKIPDGSFSKGVKKVKSMEEMNEELKLFFQKSELVIAQEFLPTEFDWRVGILGGKPLYLCKYFMAKNHWQIYNWNKKDHSNSRFGNSETIKLEQAPPGLLRLASKASLLIGNGLYGLDIKQVGKKFYVIEINDNPSIDAGIEDKIAKSSLYQSIMQHLMWQVQIKI